MITERWRQMPQVYGHEERSHKLMIGTRVYDIPVLYLDQDGIDRIRLGYLCIACMQPHERPFPPFCELETCRFPMHRYQSKVFEDLFLGQLQYGPGSTDEEEWERAKEQIKREQWEREAKKAGIIIP